MGLGGKFKSFCDKKIGPIVHWKWGAAFYCETAHQKLLRNSKWIATNNGNFNLISDYGKKLIFIVVDFSPFWNKKPVICAMFQKVYCSGNLIVQVIDVGSQWAFESNQAKPSKMLHPQLRTANNQSIMRYWYTKYPVKYQTNRFKIHFMMISLIAIKASLNRNICRKRARIKENLASPKQFFMMFAALNAHKIYERLLCMDFGTKKFNKNAIFIFYVYLLIINNVIEFNCTGISGVFHFIKFIEFFFRLIELGRWIWGAFEA